VSREGGAEAAPAYGRLSADAEGLAAFRALVLDHYRRSARSFPWRETRDPWAVLVSEVMLQQTQVDRVAPKYLAFLEAFPRPADLAAAPLSELLRLWSGLGYNRRALALKRAAEALSAAGAAGPPDDEEALLALPGVGPYTARAVLAFAYERPTVFVETNIRTVFLYHFFPEAEKAGDAVLEPLVAASLRREDPRTWYYALMDYGSALKREYGNPNARGSGYARQSPFEDSHRRIRGAILRELGAGPATRDQRIERDRINAEAATSAETAVVAEGFAAERGGEIFIGD